MIRIAEVRSWLFDFALPLWSRIGVDYEDGGFVEHLASDAAPAAVSYKRVRAQCRQIYVFSHADLLGFKGARPIADHGWRFLNQHAQRGDGVWVRRLSKGGAVIDATCDAYDMAFVLFAHAWRYRVTGDEVCVHQALAAVEVLDQKLAHPNGLGWIAFEGDQGPRQQNPHMHILEAAVELYLTTGHLRFQALARQVAKLFRESFFDRERSLLPEFFDQDWAELPNPSGRVTEPGHQAEWAWLLYRAGPIVGHDMRAEARALAERSERSGRDPRSGLLYDEVDFDGTPISRHSRLWPQTEAIKANLALFEHEGVDTRQAIAASVNVLLDRYLAVKPYGVWIDHFDAAGVPRADKIPSTSFYHLFLAFSELLRLEPQLNALGEISY